MSDHLTFNNIFSLSDRNNSLSLSLYSCHSSRLIPAVLAALGAVSPGLFQIARVCSSNVNFPITILDCYLASLFRRYPLESRTRQLCKAECDCAPCTRLVHPCVPTFFSNRSFDTKKMYLTSSSILHALRLCLMYQCSSWVSSCGLCHDRRRLSGKKPTLVHVHITKRSG